MTTKTLDTAELSQFTGTQEWHRWSVLYRQCLLTDGAKYVADQAGAYWLTDAIASYQRKLIPRGETFQTWTLRYHEATPSERVFTESGSRLVKATRDHWTLTCDDGNGKVLITQEIEFSDFPLPEFKLWAIWDGQNTVILLPSEY